MRTAIVAVLFTSLIGIAPAFASGVTIKLPANGSKVSGRVSISATNDPGVVWSNYYIDGKYYASTPPSTVTWDSTKVANGTHSISAIAFSATRTVIGNSSSTFAVVNSSQTLKLISPIAGAQVSGTITIAANQPTGVVWENFYVDGGWIASSPPFSFGWNTNHVANGAHTISVVSYGTSGKLGSSSVSVTVSNLTTQPTRTATPTSTAKPTVAPTVAPTIAPTIAPTAVPTVAPTIAPTIAPTTVPTIAPTIAPTPAPTIAPTIAPTPVPTIAPTAIPTIAPTAVPTSTPTTVATPGAPAVSMLAPANNSSVIGTISISAQINSSNVSWLNFYADGNWIASSPPTSILWDSTSMPDGAHTLSVTAYGVGSVNLGSASSSVMVANLSGTPTATSTSKSSGTPTATPTPAPGELRPTNQIPNNTMPNASELASFHSGVGGCGGLDDCSYMQKVDGQFTGTTTAIIEFEADKWCPNCTIVNPLDGLIYSFRDLAKAIAVNETHWYMWKAANLTTPDPITGLLTLTPSHGDLQHVTSTEPFGGSWGLFQIAEGVGQGWPSSFPLSAKSTSFNGDFKLAEQMGVEQGHLAYLKDPSRGAIAVANGYPPYASYTDSNGVLHPASTDVNVLRWGAVGNWYSGGWYDSGAINYIAEAQQNLHNQPWTKAGF